MKEVSKSVENIGKVSDISLVYQYFLA